MWTWQLTYQASEYWYIGSIMPSSAMQKYSVEARVATGRYMSRIASTSRSVSSASFICSDAVHTRRRGSTHRKRQVAGTTTTGSRQSTFLVTSSLVAFDCDRTSIKSSSSKKLPCELDSKYRIRASVSCSARTEHANMRRALRHAGKQQSATDLQLLLHPGVGKRQAVLALLHFRQLGVLCIPHTASKVTGQ